MICSLSRPQKEATLKLLARLTKVNKVDSPEKILKNVYNVVFESFTKKNMQLEAQPYAFAMTQYAADNLHLLVNSQSEELRQLLSKVAGTHYQFSLENIEKFKKEDELKKLLGIKESTVENIPSTVGKADVQTKLDEIGKKFTPIKSRASFSHVDFPKSVWSFPIAKTSTGEEVKIASVTDFLNQAKAKNMIPGDNLKTRAGTLTDLVIRKFFAEPMDYEKFQTKMLKDKEFTTAFRVFSENVTNPSTEEPSSTLSRYMEEYLKDMMYAINFIQTNYQDAYVTDLGNLIDSSSLTPEERKKFYIYSAEVGLRGELDLIAIKPDGTYTIIDIKTTDGYRNSTQEHKHAKQASIYDLIMSKVTGMKSSGVNDIIYLTTFVSNPSKVMGTKETTGNYRLSISAYAKKTNKNISPDVLQKEISLYKSQINQAYKNTATIPDINKEVKALNPFSPIDMARGRKRPGDDKAPLKSIFDVNDEMSSYENLLEGKKWLHSVFPELDDSQVAIQRISNSNAGGEFFLDAIVLYEKSNAGVAYHEGWHRFSQLYMTKAQKTDMYNDLKSQSISFKTRDGRSLNTQDASFFDIEEFLAEEFRKYAQNPSTYNFPKGNEKVKTWFQKIWAAIKAIANFFRSRGDFAYEEIFNQVYTGTFNRTSFSSNNAIFKQLNSFFVDTVAGKDTVLDNITFLKFKDFSDFTLSQYLSVNDITITDLLTSSGIQELSLTVRDTLLAKRDQIASSRAQIQEELREAVDENIRDSMLANDDNLKFFQDALDIILEQNVDGDYIRFADYMRAYFKTSNYESLRKFVGNNQERINQLVNEESLADYEKPEELGEELDDMDEKPEQNDDFEFNRSGNEKEAIANAKTELKDFFAGIPRRKNADLAPENDQSLYEYDKGGLPVTLSKQEAFYKTLRVLQGSLTWDMIIQRLNTPSNYLVFPELLSVKERLMGSSINEGLIPKFQRISQLMLDGSATEDDIQDHSKMMSFLMHFAHVMSLRNVPFETFVIKMNYSQDDNVIRSITPLQTRDNLESIIYSIINDFTKGFQLNMERKFMASDKSHMNVYEALYNIFGSGEEGLVKFLAGFGNEQFIYDPYYKKFYFNGFYIYNKFETNSPSDREMKDFFSYLGINLNEKIYDSENDKKELVYIYRRLKEIIYAFHRNTGDKIIETYSKGNIIPKVNAWKAAKDAASNPNLTAQQRLLANTNLIDAEVALKGYVNRLFSSNPVEQMLYDGRDFQLMKNPKNKIFAANLPLFQQLAKIEKNYHKRFSSGSMLVVDKLQFSFFLPNNMLLTEMLINDHVNDVADFSKYPELAHLDPVLNPQIYNSFIFSRIFAPDGSKRVNMKLGVSNIAQLSVIYPNESVESKRMQDLKEDEKILFDLLMMISEGSTEIRRLETSNTAYRLSVVNNDGNVKSFIKPVRIGATDGFSNPAFLSIVRGYIQHAAWKYQYDQNPDNRKLDVNYAGKDTLGVFDEMLSLSAPKIKTFIVENGGDMNTLMDRIERTDPELFVRINTEIANYFEDVAIRNPDSYKATFNEKMSEKGREVLTTLSSILKNVTLTDYMGNINDYVVRDFIANDFIMTMEDALLFFGDYTYYKDPIKRRKIIGNNGSINIVDGIMSQAIAAQKATNSVISIYQKEKNIDSDKNNKLVRKTVVSDVKMNSKLLNRDESGQMDMMKKIQLLRKQLYGKDISLEQLEEEKKETIEAFTDMEVGDAAAWINIDTYRQMRMREMTWDMDKDEKEFKRQQLIMKRNLDIPLTEDEQIFISSGPGINGSYSGFNVAKYAMTGPVYLGDSGPFKPGFDKMGLKVLLPEVDWNRSTRPLFENIMEKDLDYMVFDTGSKVYKPAISKAFADNGIRNVLNKGNAVYSEHAGGFFKYQQNTTQLNDKSTFSVQLRSIFYEIMLIQRQNGSVSPQLQASYSRVIKSLSDYITINSSRSLTEMGLDVDGKIRDRSTFVSYLRDRLMEVGGVDEELIGLLNTNQNGEFSTYLEALPFQKNIIDLISGVVDDNFRKIKLNGTKFYQSPEIGTTITAKKIEDVAQDQRGTIELKWHDLEIVDGKVTSTTPVECKINFRSQFRPLLNLKHPDGQRIGTLKRLNEAIQNPEWAKSNKESITFIGVRIPLQDINFSSHIIVKEFLPETVGDMIILPPEFYKQTGSDNDIDTVTATFKYLDERGKPVRRPEEDYADIVNRITELSTEVSGIISVVNDVNLEDRIQDVKQKFIEDNVYVNKGAGLEALDSDFRVVETEGLRTLAGLMDKKSVLYKILKNGEYSEHMDMVMQTVEGLNTTPRTIQTDSKKELITLIKKRNNYLKGITNDMIRSITDFMESPDNFDFLTETDSITKIKEMAADTISRKTGRPVDTIKLGAQQTSLQAMSYVMNIVNHKNNFEVRSILGSIVKFRSIMSLLSKIDTTLQKKYVSGSMINLLNRKNAGLKLAEGIQNKLDKTYGRNIYTPLLYKKDTSKGISVSIFDEDGQRITKNLSMIASSLLDLFKNMDVFPSLGISWLNVKPLVFLMATGVPMDRAVMFLNNPIVQEVQKELNNLGTNAKDRHALVSVVQKFSGDDIFKSSSETPQDNTFTQPDTYDTKVVKDGNEIINNKMRRPGKAGEQYLEGKFLQFTEEELVNFTRDYGNYINDSERTKYTKNLAAFLRANPGYNALARDIAAYYATLLEDGDIFYAYFVKGLSRNSAKLNSNSAIATAKAVKTARMATGIANAEFEDRLENESTHSPFFKDPVIQNVIANAMPQLLDNPDIYFKSKFRDMLENITSQTFGTVEEKRNVEMRVLSDFIEFIYKNFFILKDSSRSGNTLYEYFQFDITPLLGPMVEGSESYKKFIDEFSKQKEAILSEDTKIESLYSESLFANQIEIFRVKYPELRAIRLVDELLNKKEHSINPQKDSNMEVKDVLNMLSQSYIMLNLSSNPKDKEAEETIMRDEWKKLVEFNLSQFPSIEAEVGQDVDRIEFYKNKDNIVEIRSFFRTLAYYALAQSSHIEKTRASFSYLAPTDIIKQVVQTGIDNFNRFISTAGSMFDNMGTGNEKGRKEVIDTMLSKFEKMFKDMNGDLKWQNAPGNRPKPSTPEIIQEGDELWGTEEAMMARPRKQRNDPGLPYKKAHTGKLYSKIEDNSVDFFKRKLMKEMDISSISKNSFKIQIFTDENQDPLNCEI